MGDRESARTSPAHARMNRVQIRTSQHRTPQRLPNSPANDRHIWRCSLERVVGKGAFLLPFLCPSSIRAETLYGGGPA